MTSAAHSGRWDISPGQDRDQDKENSVPVLSLVQFSKAPFVSFGAVTLGSSRSAVLRLQNPSEDTEARVTVDRVPAKKGFSVGQDRFTLEAGGVFSLQITWTPTEEGGLRELILFSANGVVKHQAVLLGRAEAPRRKKKTLWDSIKNKPGTGKVSGPRARRAVALGSKMAANKTFQVSQKAQSKRQSRSPLATLNRGSHRSSSAAGRVLVNAKENQDFLTVPENKDLSKVLNKTLSPIGTPDRLKKLMPRIDPVDTALTRSSLGPSLRSPTLSITDALALIDSDLSPIRSSPQSSDFSDSLDSKSGRFGAASEPQTPLAGEPQIPLAGEPQIPLAGEPQTPMSIEPRLTFCVSEPQTLLAIEPRLTFCVSKNSAAHNVKMFTSTTVTKARAPVAATATSGRKIKRSRRRLLEQTLELSDCSSHSDSRAGTPCLPVIDADAGCTPGGGSSSVRPGPELSERVHYETISDSTNASLAANSFLFSSGLEGLCVASENREERTHVSFASCPAAEVSLRAAAMAPSQPPPLQPPLFLASSPESFPVHLPAQGCKRKSQEFLSADAEAAGAEQGAQVKRSRAAPQKKTAAPQQRRAAASVSAGTTLRSAPQTALSSRPAARRAPSLKSAAHKSRVVAVAQSKLTFFKPTQTAMPRHPMSSRLRSCFFTSAWMEKSGARLSPGDQRLLTAGGLKVQPPPQRYLPRVKVSAAAVVLVVEQGF
uniref:Abnormal spindle-like microcephaly-associated protein ASH domain-containing protein n=1 Tax=Knipowitschia caucasica TaxID=637954 RepID=A0AAV2KTI7_KNICA